MQSVQLYTSVPVISEHVLLVDSVVRSISVIRVLKKNQFS